MDRSTRARPTRSARTCHRPRGWHETGRRTRTPSSHGKHSAPNAARPASPPSMAVSNGLREDRRCRQHDRREQQQRHELDGSADPEQDARQHVAPSFGGQNSTEYEHDGQTVERPQPGQQHIWIEPVPAGHTRAREPGEEHRGDQIAEHDRHFHQYRQQRRNGHNGERIWTGEALRQRTSQQVPELTNRPPQQHARRIRPVLVVLTQARAMDKRAELAHVLEDGSPPPGRGPVHGPAGRRHSTTFGSPTCGAAGSG
jgi:hypothetical protein